MSGVTVPNCPWHSAIHGAIGVPLSDVTVPFAHGTVPKCCRGAGFRTSAYWRNSCKLPGSAKRRNHKSDTDLMPTGTHLGESRSSQSSERSQSVFGLFWGWVRPGAGGAARSRTTRKGLCSIGIYGKPAACMATGLLADSDGLSNPETGGGVTGSELFTSAEGIGSRFPLRPSPREQGRIHLPRRARRPCHTANSGLIALETQLLFGDITQ